MGGVGVFAVFLPSDEGVEAAVTWLFAGMVTLM